MSRRFSWLFLTFFLLPLSLSWAGVIDLTLHTGEIRFDGTVASVDATAKKVVITVKSFTLPSGKSSKLAAPKPKTVSLAEADIVTPDGSMAMAFSEVETGASISVIAKDSSAGPVVQARIAMVTLLVPDEESEDDHTLKPGELRYEGKVTGLLTDDTFSATLVSSTDSAGKVTEFNEPQARNIQIKPETHMVSRSEPARKVGMNDLKIGMRVTVTGKLVPVKIVAAREVLMWDDQDNRTRSLGTVTISAAVSALLRQGDAEQATRSFETALKYYNQAMTAAVEHGDSPGRGLTYGRLALTYDDIGQPQKALECYQQAIAIWQQLGNFNSEATAHLNLGGYYIGQNDLKNARAEVETAIRLYPEANARGLGIAHSRLGYILDNQGETAQAVESWQHALSYIRQAPEREEELTILGRLVVAYAELKQPVKAAELITTLTDIINRTADKDSAASAHFSIGNAYYVMGSNEKAKTSYLAARALWVELDHRESVAMVDKRLKLLEPPATEDGNAAGAITPAN